MRRLYILILLIGPMLGCSTDMYHHDLTLDEALDGEEQVAGNVIACAASNEDDGLVSVFFYQRDGASNVKYYETESADVDKDDFENYYRIDLSATDVFNGYLKKFEVAAFEEKWVIVTFEEAGKVHLSNPIRLKHETRPTEYLPQNVYVDDGEPGSPVFTWDDGTYTDSEIYFQVVSDAQGNLLSGTYTLENRFQFYNLDNVVLNITEQPPSALKSSSAYTFTLLAVSADNWVNLYSEIDFRAK